MTRATVGPIRLVAPLPPNLANGRVHFRVKHTLRAGYLAALDAILLGSVTTESLNDLTALSKLAQRASTSARVRSEIGVILDAVGDLLEPRQLPGELPAEPLPFAIVSSAMTVRGMMDDDNAVHRHKWLLDWCVSAGILAGDSRRYIRWAGWPDQTVDRKAPPAIALTLTPATREP